MKVIYDEIKKENLWFDITNNEEPYYFAKTINVLVVDNNKIFDFDIEEGFTSDGTTFKSKILQFIFGCMHAPEYLSASFIHDKLVKNKSITDRKTASKVFKTVLLQNNVNWLKAELMYIGVEFWQNYIRKWK